MEFNKKQREIDKRDRYLSHIRKDKPKNKKFSVNEFKEDYKKAGYDLDTIYKENEEFTIGQAC